MRIRVRLATVTCMSDADTSSRAALPDLANLLTTEADLLDGWAKLARSPTLPLDLSAEIRAVGQAVATLNAAAERIRRAYTVMRSDTAVLVPVRPDGSRWGAGQARPVPTTGELMGSYRGNRQVPAPETYAAIMAWPNVELIDWTAEP